MIQIFTGRFDYGNKFLKSKTNMDDDKKKL